MAPIVSFLLLLAGWGNSSFLELIDYQLPNAAEFQSASVPISWLLLLLSIATAILSCIDQRGTLRPPASIGALICWILLFPQGGIALGLTVNREAWIEIARAASSYTGDSVVTTDDHSAILRGEIGFATPDSLARVHSEHAVSVLELESIGGLIGAAIEMGQFVDQNGIDTRVIKHCESACVIVALSGNRLFTIPEAQFGFHRGSTLTEMQGEVSSYVGNVATQGMVQQLRQLGVPENILRVAEKTPANEMYYVPGQVLIEQGLARNMSIGP